MDMLPTNATAAHSGKPRNHGSTPLQRQPEEWFFLASGLLTALTTLYLYLSKYHLFSRLTSNHNMRLLHSAQAWIDHGFWKLSGFLYFQEDYNGSLPDTLYQSHVPFYVFPHYVALRSGGESRFWLIVGLIPVFTAVVMSACLAVITWAVVRSLPASQRWAGVRGCASVAAVAAFSITFTSEPIWSLSWNTFDGSAAYLVFVVAIAVAFACRSTRLQGFAWLSSLLLICSAFLCARFGLATVATILFIRLTELNRRSEYAEVRSQSLFSWPVTAITLLASLSHFLHLMVAIHWQKLRFRGSDLLPRMGFTSWFENAGQGPLDYHTPLDAFTFIWRQCEGVINKLPLWLSLQHGIIWSVALISIACLVGEKRAYPTRPYLLLLLLPTLIWTVLLNQSAAEHPDLISFLWLPAYVLGAATLFARLFAFLRLRIRSNQAYLYLILLMWLFFLWQNQYFMRTYLR
jgi:hypothetical protein